MELIKRAYAWLLDYLYVGYWQVHGFLFRADAAPYLSPPPFYSTGTAPVVLIPGIYERWQFLRPIADHLHGRGYPVHVIEPLGYNRGSISAMAALVEDYLIRQDLDDAVIVAHSKGGLIGKSVMVGTKAGGRVSRMVAVNTPFSGSVYARFAPVRSIRAFSPGDRVLRSLLENLEVNQRITSVYSSFDPHIPGGSRLEGARNVRLDTMGHFRVISDPRLLEVIDAALDDSPAHDDGVPAG